MGMESHLRFLGILYILLGVIGGIFALLVLIFMGGYSGIALWAERSDLVSGPLVQVMRFSGIFMTTLMLLLSVPSVMAGMGILKYKPWGRPLAMVVSVLQLANIPLGTIIALYSFWVLMSPESEPLFTNPPMR
jgi:hypothetical protein